MIASFATIVQAVTKIKILPKSLLIPIIITSFALAIGMNDEKNDKNEITYPHITVMDIIGSYRGEIKLHNKKNNSSELNHGEYLAEIYLDNDTLIIVGKHLNYESTFKSYIKINYNDNTVFLTNLGSADILISEDYLRLKSTNINDNEFIFNRFQ
jgi:hypothetical protein